MKLIRDEPGQVVLLEGDALTIPRALVNTGLAMATLVAMALGAWLLYSVLGSPRPSAAEITFEALRTLFWLAIVGLVLLSIWSSLWSPLRVLVDRSAGELLVLERNGATSREREQRVPLDGLRGLVVEVTGSGAPRLTFQVDGGSARMRSLDLRLPVEAMDKRAETIDLAFRMAAVAGLSYQRVVRNDPRRLRLEISRSAGEGWSSLPEIGTRADYEQDRVAPGAAAVAARQVVPAFDPTTFRSDHKVTRWAPRQQVWLDKGLGLGRVALALPLLAATALFLLIGPAAVLRNGLHPTPGTPHPILAVLLLGLFGLAFGVAAVVVLYSSLPRRVDIDWTRATITVGGWFGQEDIAFAQLVDLELACKQATTRSTGSVSRHWHWCELSAHVQAGPSAAPRRVLLVTTRRSADANAPYDQTLPLATELSAALGVKRRIVGAPQSSFHSRRVL